MKEPSAFRLELATEIARVFGEFAVEYLFIGKAGALILGYPGTTQDVDLFPNKGTENARRIVTALRQIGFEIDQTVEEAIMANRDFVQLKNGPFDLDLVFAPDGIESFAAARSRRILHGEYPVANLRDILASKIASGRAKDTIELPQLQKFLEEYERQHPRPLRSSWEIQNDDEQE